MEPALGAVLHAVHYLLVVGGTAGALALVLVSRRGRPVGTTPPRSPHEARVLALREAVATGELGRSTLVLHLPEPEPEADPRPAHRGAPTLLPVAAVSSAAAAGVHAAATVAHLEQGPLVGGFFVLVTLLQLWWAATLLLEGPTRTRLVAGLLLNAAVVTVWAASRMAALPFGVAEQEAVGAWDLSATAWELAVVLCCAAGLHLGATGRRLHDIHGWSTGAKIWLSASAAWLVLLTVTTGHG